MSGTVVGSDVGIEVEVVGAEVETVGTGVGVVDIEVEVEAVGIEVEVVGIEVEAVGIEVEVVDIEVVVVVEDGAPVLAVVQKAGNVLEVNVEIVRVERFGTVVEKVGTAVAEASETVVAEAFETVGAEDAEIVVVVEVAEVEVREWVVEGASEVASLGGHRHPKSRLHRQDGGR